MRKTRNFFYFIKSLLIFFSVIYIFLTFLFYFMCVYAGNKLSVYNNNELLRIKIYGSTNSSSGNTISGTFSIIDSNGYEIATIERSWKGAYLAVEFSQVSLNDKKFIFPSRIYGKNQIIQEKNEVKNGTTLDKYYNDKGQCMLLGYDSSYEERKYLFWLSSYAMKKYPLFHFGAIKTYNIDLSNCKPDIYYSISTDANGNVYMSEL